jgi:hypothetical protein
MSHPCSLAARPRCERCGETMNWNTWIKGWQLGLDARHVIAMRMLRISAGGAQARAECRRMVSEKLAAGAAAQAAALAALFNGNGAEVAASQALIPIHRTVRANRRRLGRAG